MPRPEFRAGRLGGMNISMSEVLEHVGRLAGFADKIANAVHVIHGKSDTGVFVHPLAHGHVVAGVALLILGMGDDSVAIHVVVGEGMVGARAIAESHGGSGDKSEGGGSVDVADDGVGFHGRVWLMLDC